MIVFGADTVGYIYQVDCDSEGWSYIGQSSKLDPESIANYFGSGHFMTRFVDEHGTGALTKRVVAASDSQIELDYLEILLIANARKNGVDLTNGDWGGPRPFPVFQRHVSRQLPDAPFAALNPDDFYRLIRENRPAIEEAIVTARAVPAAEFYAGFALDLQAVEDLSHACPTCGSASGEVCRTNAKSLTKPHNPTRNHRNRPVTR